jgi:hypothetical protein
MNNNHSQTPAAQDATARAVKKINDLLARHWHLDSVGLGNCRAAQRILCRLNEELLIQSAALANANFNPDEPRDRQGQWTNNASGTGTTRPPHSNTTHRPDHSTAKDATAKPKTSGTAGGTKPAPAATPPPEKIALSTDEPALMLERLLLAETLGAEEHGFKQADALKSVRALGALIYNRAHAKQLGFSSIHYPTNLLGVIQQSNQFAGFEHYNPKDPKGGLSDRKLHNIDIWMQGANDPEDKRNYTNYLAIVKQVKETAQNINKGKVDDPFSPSFTFAIKTAGPRHADPGGSFQFLGTAAGNNFYGFSAPSTNRNQIHP